MLKNQTLPSTFLSRIQIYFREMFPVQIYVPYIIILYFALNFTAQAVSGQPIVIDRYAIVGMITAFMMMILLRTFDDLKDVGIDQTLFPDRAIPRGDVHKRDVQVLSWFSFITLLVVNIGFGRLTLPYFAFMMVYALLTFYWFFSEELHRKNLFLTMADHQPLPMVVNFFLIMTALQAGGLGHTFTWKHFVVLLLFTLPITAWETGRKVRSPDMETDYETFSMIFGVKIATLIPFVCVLIAAVCGLFVGTWLQLPLTYFILNLGLLAYAAFMYLRFYFKPTRENNVLKNTALIFTTALFFSLLGHLIYTSHFVNQL